MCVCGGGGVGVGGVAVVKKSRIHLKAKLYKTDFGILLERETMSYS